MPLQIKQNRLSYFYYLNKGYGIQARIQSNLNRRGSGKKGVSRIKQANFGIIFGNIHVIFTNFLKKKGGSNPQNPPPGSVNGICILVHSGFWVTERLYFHFVEVTRCSIFICLCSVLQIIVDFFLLFTLAMILSVILLFTAFDYLNRISKRFLQNTELMNI